MDKLDVKLVKSENAEKVVLVAGLGLGNLAKEKGIDDKGNKYISIPITTNYVMKLMQEQILRHVNFENCENLKERQQLKETIVEFMQEYAKAYMLDQLGIAQTPIMQDENGNLIGFKAGCELNITKE